MPPDEHAQSSESLTPLSRNERVDLLFKEMMRISDPYHKAVDNYYRILGVPLPIIGALYGIASKDVANGWLSAIVPFACLVVVLLEMQIRTTIMCASKYLAIMERRISHEAGFQALLYERNLSLGNFLYYRTGALIFYRGVVFVVLGFALFVVSYFAYFNFFRYLDIVSSSSPNLSESSILFGRPIQNIRSIYNWSLGIASGWVLLAWTCSFIFAMKTYRTKVDQFISAQGIPVDVEIRPSSNR